MHDGNPGTKLSVSVPAELATYVSRSSMLGVPSNERPPNAEGRPMTGLRRAEVRSAGVDV
jgi:hypothetical protein